MTGLLTGLFQGIILDVETWLNDYLLNSHLEGFLRIEIVMGQRNTTINPETFTAAYRYIYSIVIGLLILKFLWKGFSIYILWRDGDADNSPQDMLTGSVQALITALAFPELYNIMADVAGEFAKRLMNVFGLAGSDLYEWESANLGVGLVEIVCMLVYLVLLIVLYVRMIQKGFELMILRLGIPFACMGLIDSDYGIFKSYMQTLFKAVFTAVIQVVLLSASLPVMVLLHPIWGIAIISTAFATPTLLQQFLIATGRGSGITQKVYSGAMTVRAIKGVM